MTGRDPRAHSALVELGRYLLAEHGLGGTVGDELAVNALEHGALRW